ncbi:hypothetical protein GGS23DRAFT_525465 [Durotheca rogersii]|uniref:uncharacterized protein n=1 Tax=Durotheca rogersii TaxID=419775 RepID=UPI0022207E7D|nr:uncharacterized protein GGS23DRAFT_525465 [Durotheca rogersii]KAI5863294.1 hypothetical protein GGS23DRAFT_525465 [Durotheca rogersii]
MCGDQCRQSCGGALAVLTRPARRYCPLSMAMAGRLAFHDKGNGGSTATHVTYTPGEDARSSLGDIDACVVIIHETGDLTTSAIISPVLCRFSLARGRWILSEDDRERSIEVPLSHPMRIEVGGEGIIGRRVTLWSEQSSSPAAEGIIGYN